MKEDGRLEDQYVETPTSVRVRSPRSSDDYVKNVQSEYPGSCSTSSLFLSRSPDLLIIDCVYG